MSTPPHNHSTKNRRIPAIILKTLLWLLITPIALVALLIIALQFPKVQSLVTNKAAAFLSSKIHSKVQLEKVSIVFPKSVSLQGLYVEDEKKDTLFYGQWIKADLDLLKLLSKKISLHSVELENLTGHIYRNTPGGKFNFSFIPEAFASKDTAVQKKDGSPGWQFSVDRVSLKKICFTHHDRPGGINTDIVLGQLQASMEQFDLDKKIIHVRAISLKNTNVSVVQNIPLQTQKDTTPSPPFDFDIVAKKIKLDSVNVAYTDNTNGQNLKAELGQLALNVNKADLNRLQFDLGQLLLHNSNISYVQNKAAFTEAPKAQASAAKVSQPLNWNVKVKDIDIENNTVAYNNGPAARKKNVVDFDHLQANSINIKARNIDASETAIHADLDNISLAEQSGFEIKKLQAKIVYDSVHADLSKLHLQTGNSQINDHIGIQYHSLQQLSDSVQNTSVELSLDNTSIAVKDVLYFAPQLMRVTNIRQNKNESIQLAGKLKGKLDDLTVEKFEVRTGGNTSIRLTGGIRHLPDVQNVYASAAFDIKSSRRDLYALLQDSLIPSGISIPESFSIKGHYTGYPKNFDAEVDLRSSFGAIASKIKMNPKAGNVQQPYSGNISITEFDLGKLLKQPQTFGPITLNAQIKGSGFGSSDLDADVAMELKKAVFKKYPYSDLSVNGHVHQRSFSGTAKMDDKNLAFTYNGVIDLDGTHPKYTFTLDLAGADLKALNLSDEGYRMSLLIQSDISAQPNQNITGRASIKNMLVIRNDRKYPVDSLVLSSAVKDGISDISLNSELFNANLNGETFLAELPAELRRQINSYFDPEPAASAATRKKQNFKFKFQLTDPSLITGNLVPKMQKLTPFAINGSFDSDAKDIELHMNIPQIQYDSIMVDSLRLDISSGSDKLSYDVKIAELSNPTFKFENMFLGGELKNNSLSFQFNTAKDDSAKLLAIGGVLKNVNHEFELKLDQDLILNTQKWAISKNNYIHFSKQGLYANDVNISNDGQSVSVNSKEKSTAAPLEISFKNFEITTLSRLVETKKDLASGSVNGSVALEKQNGASALRSDIEIKNFMFQAVPVGTIKLKADNVEDPSKYDVDLSIEGNGNNVGMKGHYLASKNSELNFTLGVDRLNLASVEPFTFGQVSRMSGSLHGRLSIKGPVSLPQINGDLIFSEAAFRPRLLNSYLTVHNSKMSFDGRKVRFNNFVMNDSLKHKAALDGSADLSSLKSIGLDLRLRTDDFLALNTARKDNPLYYGTIIVDSDIRVKGTVDEPVIDGRLKLNQGSAITYVKPENEITRTEDKGIVQFVNKRKDRNIAIMARRNDSISGLSNTKGITLRTSVDIDRTVLVKMIIDPESGDSLFIKGGGLLDFGMDPSGKMSLSGKYRIIEGGYYLSLENLVKRSFRIQKGSTVTWTGDILDAYADLTAVYDIKTSPIDLVQNEMNGADELEKNKYRNQLNFQVFLKMSGFISSPQISFDIQLKPEDRGALNGAVNNRLGELREDETQLNKQVFALLTLGRFIGENPLESSSDGGLSSASRASASKVLTQQLSNLSNKYVSFVNLDLGVNSYEDYSTGQEQGRTQLQVGVSKQLFKDRITVRVGGNVDLEGERASQNDINDVAGDVNIDYKITSDGRYKLKGFRENQYENPIEGELVRTGAGIVYVRNFNTFKQLFSKPVQPKKKDDKKNDDDNDTTNDDNN